MTSRMNKIDEQIKREVAKEIFERFPGEMISVTKVQTSRDLSHAKIWISPLDRGVEIVAECQMQAPHIMHALFDRLKLRKIPKLHFVLDETSINAEKIDKLINSLRDDH